MQRTRRTVTMKSCAVLVALGVSLVCGASARALAGPIVLAGHDLFATQAGAQQSFSLFPIPADFFFPGSDPFVGAVALCWFLFEAAGATFDFSYDTLAPLVELVQDELWNLPM